MAEFLITPKTTTASPHAPVRDNESRAKEAARTNADAGMPAPFAAVLKSMAEKNRPEPDKDASPEPGPPPADSAATNAALVMSEPLVVPAPPIATSALPYQLEQAPPVVESAALMAPTADASSTNAEQVDPFLLAAAASASVPTAAPLSTSGAVSQTPTFAGIGTRGMARNNSDRDPGLAAGLDIERRPTGDKLAAEAAFSAASASPGNIATGTEPGAGDFHAVMERTANNPANVLMQINGTATAAKTTTSLQVETAMGQAGWRDEMGQKLTWMVSNHRQQAELVLNPPHLGRIEVTLTLDGDRATVNFASPHAAVRETLENSMTRLREVLADAGVTLGQTHVGAESRNNPNSMHWKGEGLASGRMDDERQNGTPSVLSSGSAGRSVFGRGMVDIFA